VVGRMMTITKAKHIALMAANKKNMTIRQKSVHLNIYI